MEISEVRVKLIDGSEDRLRAFCSITLDGSFVIRDLKIIDGATGPFVAMPSRKLTRHCGRCGYKNHLRAGFCNQCGAKQTVPASATADPQKLYADIAHPINSECREQIQAAVVTEFEAELARSAQPGYQSQYDDDFDVDSHEHLGDEDLRDEVTGPDPRPAPAAQPDVETTLFGAGLFDDQQRIDELPEDTRLVRGDDPAPAPPRPHTDHPTDTQPQPQRVDSGGGPPGRRAGEARPASSTSPKRQTKGGFGAGLFD